MSTVPSKHVSELNMRYDQGGSVQKIDVHVEGSHWILSRRYKHADKNFGVSIPSSNKRRETQTSVDYGRALLHDGELLGGSLCL